MHVWVIEVMEYGVWLPYSGSHATRRLARLSLAILKTCERHKFRVRKYVRV